MNARQRALHTALLARSDNPIVQLGLIYAVAKTVGATQQDVNVVQKLIAGGPVVECAG